MMNHEKPGIVEKILERNFFYYQISKYIKVILIVQIVILLMSVLYLIKILDKREQIYYIPTTNSGIPIAMPPLTDRLLSDDQVLTFAKNACKEMYNYDFINYKSNLQKLRNFFTYNGYEQFLEALDNSGNLKAVIQRNMIVSGQVMDVKIKNQGAIQDRYGWRLEVKVRVSYFRNANDNSRVSTIIEDYVGDVLVVRMPTQIYYPNGVAVSYAVFEKS